jgi:hypothetical protein
MEIMKGTARSRSHQRNPDEPKTVLVQDRSAPDHLQLRTSGPWLRFRAQAWAGSLDDKLAQGVSPESQILLAVRASRLVSPHSRRQVARNWKTLLERSKRPRRTARLRPVPVISDRVVEAETSIEDMVRLLSNGLPIPVRGVAMANWLLRDGLGPIYNHQSPIDLTEAIRQATELLDPRTSLTPAA